MQQFIKKQRLTQEIAREYQRKVATLTEGHGQNIGRRSELRDELMQMCGVTEIEAINILNGYNVEDYIRKYEILSGEIIIEMDEKTKSANQYLLRELEEMESKLAEQLMLEKELMG